MATSVEIRAELVKKLQRDLIGPYPVTEDADISRETLGEEPSRWYLTGFIAPAPESERAAEDPDDPAFLPEIDNSTELGTGEDDEAPESDSVTRRRIEPTSVGLSTTVQQQVASISVGADWGDYKAEPPLPEEILSPDAEFKPVRRDIKWIREPRSSILTVEIKEGWRHIPFPDSAALQRKGGGLELAIFCRPTVLKTAGKPDAPGWAISAFVVNKRATVHRRYADLSYAFQVRLTLTCEHGFCASNDLSSYVEDERDLRVNDLHYADVAFYASGHNTASDHRIDEDGTCRVIWTEPMPRSEVERVAPNEDIRGVEFGMDALAAKCREGGAALRDVLAAFPDLYGAWIATQRAALSNFNQTPDRKKTAQALVDDQERARSRMADGIALLATDDRARLAFEAMNESVSRAARKRRPDDTPAWRPFQLAFILLNLSGLTHKTHKDREIVDLLFFPTGGGKTEAYLGLSAYIIALRRFGASDVLGAGVTVIMRYTLRLLTLDQLGRAAGVICALELMRDEPRWKENGRRLLGEWPIEIGLWIGSKSSPNKLGGRGNTGDDTAVTRVRRFRTHGRDAPAPIKVCPWCSTEFSRDSFHCHPNSQAPMRMQIQCANATCEFSQDRPLPILAVDEEIYRRLPAFLIATVDKFASLPWIGETGAFFGHVDRFEDGVGFYGAAERGNGYRLHNSNTLDPPDLIIQDELHLISGPLGTVAALYETVIDALSTRQIGETRVRPKIVASTATVRRAARQIEALFDRKETAMFPPAGISRRDSFFAQTRPSTEEPARLYVGLAALGRGPKLVFLRALSTIMSAAQEAAVANAGASPSSADPYLTALCYFNALRELGSARRIVEDEVRDKAARYGTGRRRVDPPDQPFADRKVGEPVELTSRISTDQVALAKKRLETVFGKDNFVDVALATNMISVGLDITRLGLMFVQGQPKMAAEYIQATSRVGRDSKRPGLVLALLNVHKPRDRTHYERFAHFHETFYRSVEATSVTPWAARALDRALSAVIVGLVRHLDPRLTPDNAVATVANYPTVMTDTVNMLVARAGSALTAADKAALAANVRKLLDDWATAAHDSSIAGTTFRYDAKRGPNGLLHNPLEANLSNLDPRLQQFVAGRSMRDVEQPVSLLVKDPRNQPITNARDLQ
jgi:hypothetical protein